MCEFILIYLLNLMDPINKRLSNKIIEGNEIKI